MQFAIVNDRVGEKSFNIIVRQPDPIIIKTEYNIVLECVSGSSSDLSSPTVQLIRELQESFIIWTNQPTSALKGNSL